MHRSASDRAGPDVTKLRAIDVEPAPPAPWIVYATLALLCLIWGSTWLVIKEGLRDLPPMTSAAIRFALAALVFVAIAPALRRREGGAEPPRWLSLSMGTLNFAVPYGLVYWGETVIPSGLASVLWAVFPMMMAVAGHFMLPGERLTPAHAAGFVLGFVGVVLLFVADLRAIGPAALGVGAVFLLSPLVSAFGNVLVKRHGGRVSSACLNRNGLVICAVLLACAAGLFEPGAELRWTGRALFSIVYLALVGTVVSFGLYFWMMRYAPASKLSLIAYVIPAIALCLGWAVGDETVGPHTLAGAGLILAGVSLAAGRRGRKRSERGVATEASAG
jgi:drug/metabolite transporter (DMT)-like permease